MADKKLLHGFMNTVANPSTSYVDIRNVAEKQKQRKQSEDAIAKEEDYYQKVRELKGLRATGNNPMQTINNAIGDLIGNSPQQMAENAIMGIVPAERLVSKVIAPLARMGLGRVMTNVALPVGYSLDWKKDFIRNSGGMKAALKAIVKDEALWSPENAQRGVESMMKRRSRGQELGLTERMLQEQGLGEYDIRDFASKAELAQGRDVPYREIFGNKPRYNTNLYEKNADGSLKFNDKSIQYTGGNRNESNYQTENPLYNSIGKDVLENESRIPKTSVPNDEWVKPETYIPTNHPVMAGYDLKYNPAKRVAKYSDTWDFKLNNGESIIPKVDDYVGDGWEKETISRPATLKELKDTPGIREELYKNMARSIINKTIKKVKIEGAVRY